MPITDKKGEMVAKALSGYCQGLLDGMRDVATNRRTPETVPDDRSASCIEATATAEFQRPPVVFRGAANRLVAKCLPATYTPSIAPG